MKKRELKDVNVLFNEYDEMMFKLQRDDINLLRNVVFSVMSSFMLSLLISWIIYSSIHFEIVILMLVPLSFTIVFIVYNCSSIKGLNEILKQIKEENNLNYRISVVKNSLNDLGFDFKENKIPKRKLLYFINYWKINEIFCYKIYLKYEIKNKKNLLKKIEELREKKQENKNITIQILEKIKSLSILVITTLLYKHLPSIFEKLNNGDISFMNVVYYIQKIIFVILMLALLIYFIMYIINSLKLNEKKLQIEKLKFIENCIYYLDNSEEIEITETINKLEKQEEVYGKVSQITDSKISNELQTKIKEYFEEIPRKYLKEYQEICNNQEISDEEKQEKLSNKLSELLISIETEKDFYRESKIIEINKKKEEIYRKISKISDDIISDELQLDIEKNFGEITKKYLKKYQDISKNQTTENNEELKNRFSKLLISIEIEKNLYKIEKVTKTLEKIKKQREIYEGVSQITDSTISNELQAEIDENFGEIPRKYLKEYQAIYNNQETSDEEKQEKLSNKLSELLISMEIEKNLYKKSKILENQDLIKSKIINKKLWILPILFLVVLVVLFNNLGKKEYILNNPTNKDIEIIVESKKIKLFKNSNIKRNLKKPDIKIGSNIKCEFSFDSDRSKRIINFSQNKCFPQDELEISEKKRNYILVNSTDNDIEITLDKNHYKLKSKYSIVLQLKNGNYELANGCNLEVKDDSEGQLIEIKKENNSQKCDKTSY